MSWSCQTFFVRPRPSHPETVPFFEGAISEGECQQLQPGQIGPSLLEVARNPERWPDVRRQLTVFDSTGWALEDFVALQLARELAIERRIGTWIDVAPESMDPWNPYEGVLLPSVLLTGAP